MSNEYGRFKSKIISKAKCSLIKDQKFDVCNYSEIRYSLNMQSIKQTSKHQIVVHEGLS
jgi:hypothetical protein